MAIWTTKGATKKLQVKINGVKLVGMEKVDKNRLIYVQIKWQEHSRSGFSSFYRKSHHHHHHHDIQVLKFGDDDQIGFVNVCSFSIVSKHPLLFSPYLVNFIILNGENRSSKFTRNKMQVIGRADLNLGELASKMESQVEEKLPITVQLDGITIKAMLMVIVSFVEMETHSPSRTMSQVDLDKGSNPGGSTSILRRVVSHGPPSESQDKGKKNKFRLFGKLSSSKKLDESPSTSNSGREYVVVASDTKNGEPNSVTELGMSSTSEAQLDLVKKGGFWKWKRRRSEKKIEFSGSTHGMEKTKNKESNIWQLKELTSRDGKTKLKANVLLASYDQRDEKAAGESACAAIVALFAHWLLLNPGSLPTGPELDRLITEGSTEWRKLCKNQSNREFFPDQHFDLETILKAGLRPVTVLPSNSRFGFFHPEDFECLKHAPSFDDIWDEINNSVNPFDPRVYIVRWNDHFFVLKIEKDANYIIDSLGERLHEGCNRAYILKFDESSVMSAKNEREEERVICRGKGCCKEYMKRFLAAIPLRELKEAEQKGKTVDIFALYQRLQIDFHLSTPSSSSANSAVTTAHTSVAGSPNTSPVLNGEEEYVQVNV